jgi:hypothetical protein
MSLDQPPPSLRVMKGRLETIETEWTLATDPKRRKELNEEFKTMADEIKRTFGEDGRKVVDQVVAKHRGLHYGQGGQTKGTGL